MAVDYSLYQASLSLYRFLCQHIVGTEETVRKKRLMITIQDRLSCNKIQETITSGSTGEGLNMEGSDLDVMHVCRCFIVHEDTRNVTLDPQKINLVMEINDTKPGFSKLRWVNLPKNFVEDCTFNGKSWYLSSDLWKSNLSLADPYNTNNVRIAKIHGPCLSNDEGTFDLAVCLHNPKWVHLAEEWITRPNRSWPSSDVKSGIIEHGVLFVPIGSKGSDKESLEWRISFSVAEKLLIYSFSHTQLLCYALMKILLKDIINHDRDCKDLLCSYFIKTIILWVSEEIIYTEWRPEMLIQCFLRCLRRLLYCVKYSMCPHYFIPIINMFENKVEGQSRKVLLERLNTLFSCGWHCLLFSEQFHNFTIHSNEVLSTLEIKAEQLLLLLKNYFLIYSDGTYDSDWLGYRRLIRCLSLSKSAFILSNYSHYLSIICSELIECSTFSLSGKNKKIYSQNRRQLSYLLQNVNHDAVSGWLRLAAFFYNTKQYKVVLCILSHVLMKFTPEKVHFDKRKRLSELQLNLVISTTLQSLGIMRLLKLIVIQDIVFLPKCSKLMPEELSGDWPRSLHLHPELFAHFLCFLCHYHLNDKPKSCASIKELQRTIDRKTVIKNANYKSMGYFFLGKALFLVGQTALGKEALRNGIELLLNDFLKKQNT